MAYATYDMDISPFDETDHIIWFQYRGSYIRVPHLVIGFHTLERPTFTCFFQSLNLTCESGSL